MSSETVPPGPPAPPAKPGQPVDPEDPVPKPLVRLFGAYTILLSIALLYVLVKVWPGSMPPAAADTVSLLGGLFVFPVPPETRSLLIVLLAGALGSYVHLATSFSDYVGNKQLVRSWLWWYVLRPFVGMALAVIVYFVVRAGLVTLTLTSTPPEALNLYAIAAVSGLAGMFSKQATDKLREVFDYLFTTREGTERGDKLHKPAKEEPQPKGSTTDSK